MLSRRKHLREFTRKKEAPCRNCNPPEHPQLSHYRQDGSCVIDGCGCKEYRPKGAMLFNRTPTTCSLGHSHDSAGESRVCGELLIRQKAGDVKRFEAHPKPVPELFGKNGAKVATWKVDFKVWYPDGTWGFIEAKGRQLEHDGEFRIKKALLEDKYSNRRGFRGVDVILI